MNVYYLMCAKLYWPSLWIDWYVYNTPVYIGFIRPKKDRYNSGCQLKVICLNTVEGISSEEKWKIFVRICVATAFPAHWQHTAAKFLQVGPHAVQIPQCGKSNRFFAWVGGISRQKTHPETHAVSFQRPDGVLRRPQAGPSLEPPPSVLPVQREPLLWARQSFCLGVLPGRWVLVGAIWISLPRNTINS